VAAGVWLADFLLALFTLALARQVARETIPRWLVRTGAAIRTLPARLMGTRFGARP